MAHKEASVEMLLAPNMMMDKMLLLGDDLSLYPGNELLH